MIDLHCHSKHSDGQLSVAMLLEQALERAVSMLALTDHDTVSGVNELQSYANNQPITIITGIEVSVRWKKHDIHIVGLNIDTNHAVITHLIEQQSKRRYQRAELIADSLSKLGVDAPLKLAKTIAGHDNITRPHFAQVLVDAGFVKDLGQAFKQYLARGKPAYHHCEWASIPEAVAAIKASGGVAVLAHPKKYDLTRTKLHLLIESFKEAGGEALEVVSGNQGNDSIKEMAAFCDEYGMLASTGSDFHGWPDSQVKLGGQPALPENLKAVWSLWTTK